MNKKEKLKLTKLYEELLEKETNGGDGVENYTNGYRWGKLNGKLEILEYILGIDTGVVSEKQK